jgi:hypothetical protein
MIVEKKSWPELFKKVKSNEKHFDVRLADFKIKKGDIIILNEWNPKTKKYTGRKLKLKAGFIFKIPKDMKKFYSEKEIKKCGFYIIELRK